MSLIQDFKENVADISDRAKRFFTPLSAEEKLEKAKTLLATIPEGKELLALAERLDCPIQSQRTPGYGGMYIQFPKDHVILISPHFTLQGLTMTLAHELRHMWQHQQVPELYSKNILFSTASRLAITRIIEGDAFTFEKTVMAKIKNKTSPAHQKDFQSFQASIVASYYDFESLSRRRQNERLKNIFNDHAFHYVPDLRKILVPGLNVEETPYITAENEKALLSGVLETSRKQRFKRALTWFAKH